MSLRITTIALLLVVFFAPQAASQSERHRSLGITLDRPVGYEPLPVQPGEPFVVLSYVDSSGTGQPAPGEVLARPVFHIVVIEKDERAVRFGQAGRDTAVTDIETYLRRELPTWRSEALRGGRSRWGHRQRRFDLHRERGSGPALAGYAHAWEGPTRTVALIGFCAKDEYRWRSAAWRRTAETMKLEAPAEDVRLANKLEREYARRHLSHADQRIAVRRALVGDWGVTDTAHFIVVHHTSDGQLVRRVADALEVLRSELMQRFPPDTELDALSTVRICRDRAEYLAYGGAPTTVGYWNASGRELVLYVADAETESADPYRTTLMILYHEAFHQFVFHSAGQLPPHPWFDEGTGDYFSGAQIAGGRLRGIGVHPWRVAIVRDLVRRGEHASLSELVTWDQATFYANANANYAQAWSLIYFLRSDAVRRSPSWSGILTRYFSSLKSAWAEERTKLGRGSDSRRKALEAAFAGVDWAELETAWVAFVREL